MNFSDAIYMILFVFVYYGMLLIVPYGLSMLQGIGVLAPYWSTIPTETHWILNILLWIIVPIVAIAYTIRASQPQQVAY